MTTPIMEINPALLNLAAWRATGDAEKAAFVPPGAGGGPPGGDPSGGGPPPGGDPSGGGMPPGGPPPGADPAAAGGMPPGAPPGPPPGAPPGPAALPPEIIQAITQAVQAAMSGGQPGAAGMPGAPGAAGPGKGAKIDPGMIYLELGRVRKLMTGMYQNLNWELPQDILDDQQVAQSVAGAGPTSQPLGAAPAGQPPAGGGGDASAGPQGLPAIGTSPAVPPMNPAGMGGAGGGATKQGEMFVGKDTNVLELLTRPTVGQPVAACEKLGNVADAVAAMARSFMSKK